MTTPLEDSAFENLKTFQEVMEEIAHTRIVAVAIYHLAFEVLPVVFQLSFNICELGVELVFFCAFCRV